jgi:GNAT superfamily N-acetyltransferase
MLRYEIRRACAGDWPAIGNVHDRAIRYEPHFVDDPDRQRITALEHVFRGDLWVAVAGQSILGFVACVGSNISWLYVDPLHFRGGVGRALLRHALEHCGPVASVAVLAQNTACLALMTSEGFSATAAETTMINGYGSAQVLRKHRISCLSLSAILAYSPYKSSNDAQPE